MDLMQLLQGQLSDGLINQLSQQIGGEDKEKTAVAASGIMTTLMGALAKNATTTEGASALANALDQDHDGSVLDQVMDVIGGRAQTNNTRALNGTGIVNHVLGDRQNSAVNMISKMSGLDSNKTGSLMTLLAPIVMGALGKTKKEQGLDVAGIASLLSGTVASHADQNPTMGLVTRFLDKDGDGSVVDDIANMGMKFLGGFLKGKK